MCKKAWSAEGDWEEVAEDLGRPQRRGNVGMRYCRIRGSMRESRVKGTKWEWRKVSSLCFLWTSQWSFLFMLCPPITCSLCVGGTLDTSPQKPPPWKALVRLESQGARQSWVRPLAGGMCPHSLYSQIKWWDPTDQDKRLEDRPQPALIWTNVVSGHRVIQHNSPE